MKQIGEKLKSARIKKELTLDDISQETKIKVKYLKNIEEGEFDKIPGGEPYVKGFIKNYASCVDINGEEIIQEYKKLNKEDPDQLTDEKSDEQSITIFPEKVSFKNTFLYKAAALLIIVIVIISIFFVFKKNDLPQNQESLNIQQKAEIDNTPSNTELNKSYVPKSNESNQYVPDTQSKVIKIKEDENNVYYLIDSDSINMKFKTTDRCWISVNVDGTPVFEGTIKETDNEKEWAGKEKIVIRIGNPLSANIYINGFELNGLGKTARNFVFEKSK
ncbi:MAG: hypothetical protein PWQ82_506 [Thermosediminibacterales bacterium]|nr:hypothetical protein [Thermosediminibacterales bacterium]